MTEAGTAMISSYDYRLVALSVLIAIFAAYAALDLAGRTTAARGRVRLAWLIGGAAAMGSGIWSMHYIGMLAFSLPVPVSYDWPTVLVSLLAAIFASAVALFVASRRKMGWLRALIGSTIMGSGIAAMHYIGMAAMRSTAMCYYDPALFTLSVVLAILISLVALWLTFMLREDTKAAGWRKTASALVMGAAIPVMHYTGMAAARFTASTMVPDTSHAVSISAQCCHLAGSRSCRVDLVCRSPLLRPEPATGDERATLPAVGGISSGNFVAAERQDVSIHFHQQRGGDAPRLSDRPVVK